MTKPSLKLTVIILAIVAAVAGVASFAHLWPASQQMTLPGELEAREIKNASRYGGRVKQVLVKEGDMVEKGQLLIVFDDVELEAKIAEAKAVLDQALAQEKLLAKGADMAQVRQAGSAVQQAQQRLEILSRGARPEEIAQAESRLKSAEAAAKQAQDQLTNGKVMLDEGIISRQRYESLQQALDVAQSNLEAARANLKMMKSGARNEDRKIAQSQLGAAKAQYQQVLKGAKPEEVSIASADVEKARSALAALEAQRDEYRIKAPFPGNVSVVGVSEGELVGPGRPVMTIIDYSNLWADVYVPESRLSMVELGKPVSIRARSYRDMEFKGQVAAINPKSEFIPNTGGSTSTEEATFRVKVSVEPRDAAGKVRLYPGMNVDVVIKK